LVQDLWLIACSCYDRRPCPAGFFLGARLFLAVSVTAFSSVFPFYARLSTVCKHFFEKNAETG